MKGGHRKFDEARVGICWWLKLVESGGCQHQQQQHGRLAFGGVMAGQGCVESTPGKGSRALTIVVHVRSPHTHVSHRHVCHRRHAAGTQQKAMVGAGEGRKHGQPDHDRCRNEAAGEVACSSPKWCALMIAMHRNSTELPKTLDRLSSTSEAE
jgi:hypothetical protein